MTVRNLLTVSTFFALVFLCVFTLLLPRPRPAEASSAVARMSAGSFHTCAVYGASSAVKCWGRNTWGSIGDNQACGTGACPTPDDVCANAACLSLLSGVTSIASGSEHTCAVVAGGNVWCWGLNDDGQLGDGTTGQDTCGSNGCSKAPVHVCATAQSYPCGVFLAGAIYVVAGTDHTCALMTGGGVKCWGLDLSGQLGNGPGAPEECGGNDCSTTPVNVCTDATCSGFLSGAGGIGTAGASTCAIVGGSNTLECWGQNDRGQLGDNNAPNDGAYAAAVCGDAGCGTDLTGVTFAYGGWLHMCATVAGGAVKCWGANTYGQVGDGTTTDRAAPVYVCANALCSANLTGALAAGGGPGGGVHTCALMTGGVAKCWGRNDHGQLGIGTSTGPQSCSGFPCSTTPLDVCADQTCSAPVSGLATAGTLGGLHGCGILTGGSVVCGGDNDWGEVGDGTTGTNRTTVVPVVGFSSKGVPPTATPTPLPTPIVAGEVGCHTGQTGGACPGGGPAPLGDNGPATSATLYTPTGLSENSSYLYIADTNNCRIRQVDLNPPYNITTVAGTTTCGYSGDGVGGAGVVATSAMLNHPRDVFLLFGTLLFVADTDNCLIRYVDLPSGMIYDLVGVTPPNNCGYIDGAPATAKLSRPYGVAIDSVTFNLYIADTDNCRLRKYDLVGSGLVSTIGGATVMGNMCGFGGDSGPAPSAQLNHPTDVAFLLPSSLLVIADRDNNRIRTYDPATRVIATIAGTGVAGYTGDGGLATAAKLDHPTAVTALDYRVYIADTNNDAIRRVNTLTHTIDTVILDPGSKPEGVAVPSGGGGAGEGEAAGFGVGGVTYSKPQLQTVGIAGQTPENTRPGNFVPASGCGLTPGVGTIDFALPAVLLGVIGTRKRIGRFWTWFCTVLTPAGRRTRAPERSAL